jgi:hypothetical protein
MFQELKQRFIRNIKNIPGWRTSRKIVVIECDDWGGIRMPSKKVYDELIKKGIKVANHRFNRYDTLENEKDLELLFEVLNSVRDRNNHPAIMTAVSNVANPDFEKIRLERFSVYHYEPFTETLKRYYPAADVFKIWKEGMNAGIFIPEFHGREHFTVQLWMEKLRQGNKDLLVAFDHGFASLDIPGIPAPAREFMAGFYFTAEDQKPFLVNSITDGVSLFHQIFSRMPRTFAPGSGIFHPEFDQVLADCGIQFMWVNHSMPYPVDGGELKYKHFISGQKGPGGLTYYTRNCTFEPTDPDYKEMAPVMKQIEAAFRWGKPANISTHRANFTGSIDPANREQGLSELKKLLKAITEKWPDAEFMSSVDALEYMKSTN